MDVVASLTYDPLPKVKVHITARATKFITTKFNSGDLMELFTKISTHENNPLYGIIVKVHCKKLEVDLTQKRSSQLQSGFIQIQAVAHLLLPGFRVTPLVQRRFLVNNELVCK